MRRRGARARQALGADRLAPAVAGARAILLQEEECVAHAGGQVLAGGRPAVLMQCSGLGNALNALASFVIPYGLGIPLVISMRGTLGERNPAQMPMGRATATVLGALGIQAFCGRRSRTGSPDGGRDHRDGQRRCDGGDAARPALLPGTPPERGVNISQALETLLERRPDALYVAALGTVTSALRTVSSDGPHLYFGGAMGSATPAALGIAERVAAAPGDRRRR